MEKNDLYSIAWALLLIFISYPLIIGHDSKHLQLDDPESVRNETLNKSMSSLTYCEAKWPLFGPRKMKYKPKQTTMVASYPGSGARLSKKFMQAMSGGMVCSDVRIKKCKDRNSYLTVKTHFPTGNSPVKSFERFASVERSVLLIRNPAKAIPSWFSFIYEREHHVLGHSVKAPLEEWINFREKNFSTSLEAWIRHAQFWLEHNRKENTLIVTFEHLVDPQTGPDELEKFERFVSQSSGIPLIQEPEDIPCMWDYVVNSRGGEIQSHRTGGPKLYPYTDEQIDMIVLELSAIGKNYPEMANIMNDYIAEVLELQATTRSKTLY